MQQQARGDAFTQERERDQRQQQAQLPLDRRDAVVRRTQTSLDQLGFAPGPADGKMGPQTRSAIRAFQRERGLRADGRLTAAVLRDLAGALTEQRRVVAQQARQSDRRSADREAPGDVRSERTAVELLEGPETASAGRTGGAAQRGGLIGRAEAATPAASAPLAISEAEAARTRPVYASDGEYGFGDALTESWVIFTSVSGAVFELLETRVAELTD